MERTNIFQSIKNAIWNAADNEEISLPEYTYEPTSGTETYIVEGFDDAIGILALINDCMNQYWNPDQDGEVRVDTFFSVGRYIIQVSEWEEIWEDEL